MGSSTYDIRFFKAIFDLHTYPYPILFYYYDYRIRANRAPLLNRTPGTVFGHTMVNFGYNMSMNYSIYRSKCAENYHSAEPKISKF